MLAELEADGKLHLSLVYRGEKEDAKQFIEAQDQVLEELYAPEEENGEAESAQNAVADETEPGTFADGMQDMSESEVAE